MNKRDMAIAEDVRDAVLDCLDKNDHHTYQYLDFCGVDLAAIIASVVVEDEPYCWMVTGSSVPFYGEFSQIDADLEAKHCGGTAKAFPLYTAPQAPEGVESVVSNETVNVKLLEVAKRARKFAFSYAPHGGLLSELDEAIAAAEQQEQPEPLTDDEIFEILCRYIGRENDILDEFGFARAVIAAHEAKRGRISSEIPSKGGV